MSRPLTPRTVFRQRVLGPSRFLLLQVWNQPRTTTIRHKARYVADSATVTKEILA